MVVSVRWDGGRWEGDVTYVSPPLQLLWRSSSSRGRSFLERCTFAVLCQVRVCTVTPSPSQVTSVEEREVALVLGDGVAGVAFTHTAQGDGGREGGDGEGRRKVREEGREGTGKGGGR